MSANVFLGAPGAPSLNLSLDRVLSVLLRSSVYQHSHAPGCKEICCTDSEAQQYLQFSLDMWGVRSMCWKDTASAQPAAGGADGPSASGPNLGPHRERTDKQSQNQDSKIEGIWSFIVVSKLKSIPMRKLFGFSELLCICGSLCQRKTEVPGSQDKTKLEKCKFLLKAGKASLSP